MLRDAPFDTYMLEILDFLSKPRSGHRYTDIRDKFSFSDSTLTNRLRFLQSHGLLDIKAMHSVKGRSFIVYVLSNKGRQFCTRAKVSVMLKELRAFE